MARARVKITDRQAEAREEATRVLARREEARRRAERARTLRVDWTHELRFGPGTVGVVGLAADGQRVLLRLSPDELVKLATTVAEHLSEVQS